MYKQTTGVPTPQANLAINKSRLKLYGKNSKAPTYYLSKGQEFQIELFNPTKDTVMAKIFLNGKPIAQGGLVLRPAERVFLDRYIDVAKKFQFDTYEVANTSESRKAIEDNGDFKVEFYKEQSRNRNILFNAPVPVVDYDDNLWRGNEYCDGGLTGGGTPFIGYNSTSTADLKGMVTNTGSVDLDSLSFTDNLEGGGASINLASMDAIDYAPEQMMRSTSLGKPKQVKSKRSKSIETGRVAEGSHSSQKLETVSMNWEYSPFYTIEYKMLPISQKVNTIQEVSANKYCTHCGSKNKPAFKFCPSCGTKA